MASFTLVVRGHTDDVPGAMDSVPSARCIIEQRLRGQFGPYIDAVELIEPPVRVIERLETLVMATGGIGGPTVSQAIAMLAALPQDTAPEFSDVNGHLSPDGHNGEPLYVHPIAPSVVQTNQVSAASQI